ncbi:hypothetical protein [Streptomyces spirodelae]|uniref:Integrase n=1 Tax=Streptomyces spirodelae TaxID=2812904 RepID=A0ABS3WRZ8_9ACTN|nr:hypothetical protein [Streptomyces spirodelae]MBO8185892.1 hypothetical protein [Streptomyces spirodelae]
MVQKRLGHKDVLTTLRVYAHLWAEAEEKTRGVLDDAWAAARKTPAGRGESSRAGGRIPESRTAEKPFTLVEA